LHVPTKKINWLRYLKKKISENANMNEAIDHTHVISTTPDGGYAWQLQFVINGLMLEVNRVTTSPAWTMEGLRSSIISNTG